MNIFFLAKYRKCSIALPSTNLCIRGCFWTASIAPRWNFNRGADSGRPADISWINNWNDICGGVVSTLSYGDGPSRIWEGALLVMMYTFVVLIDLTTSAVFYFSCRSYSMEATDGKNHSILETMAVSPEAIAIE
ncbi:hypothetical protein HS088_TW07G00257 [Tripterygium wilfordii]|uniref:Uncharacterized protein n=1 Tax=Tripterygium wilfordii TaxID=458696 RepID=A0A7J7DE94_TRIWF|nr:hypothetical protein HS088_TW07G00257 [Tripterygium wilfordii]